MSYCLNPNCSNPKNPAQNEHCQSCGSKMVALRDRYLVLRSLGQGGFGTTFLAQDIASTNTPNYCVIKQLRPSTTDTHILQMARDLFEREARTLGKIGDHPQVPKLIDYFEENQQFYLVQEYIRGSTLQQEVKKSGPLSEAGVKQFLCEILPALEYVHSQKMIHRDIKPANVIRRQDCQLVLIDFGAVKVQVQQTIVSQSEHTTALTAYAVGTPGFAPPEQIAMRPVYASDIYALGVTCIYLLSGRSPREFSSHHSTGEMLWQKEVHVSDHFGEVLKKMLDLSVRHRYQSAQEVLRALNLEPYMESLAKSMSNQPSKTHRRNFQRTGLNFSSSTPDYSTVAASIRARRSKSEETTTILQTGILRHQAVSHTSMATTAMKNNQSSTGQKLHELSQLDAESLLTAYAKGRRDFAFKNVSQLNLQKADLPNVNFRSSKLVKTNFQGANLFDSDFGYADLSRANLKDANLGKAYLGNSDLEAADLRGADLTCAYLSNANLKGANLSGANLTGAKIDEEQLALAKTNWMTVWPNGKRGLF